MDNIETKQSILRKSDLINLSALVLVVATIVGLRINDRPLVGEETRYATAAREMIATGDWLVFRQQGQVFAERPPLTIWTVAVVGLVRGEVDVVAVRLTSAIAIVLTSLLLYLYVRSFASAFAALTAGFVYATMVQVLQIGRLGETEPFFAFLVTASLLLWHLGYLRKWPAIATWSVGFGFAALAALAKGPQAPVYFVSIIGVYLLIRRDWRFLFSWQTVVGGVLFAAVLGAWQVPYYLATDWESVVATWTGLAKDRISTDGLALHLARFPLETLGCLLPWSPMLLALIHRPVRKRLAQWSPVVTFLVVALLVSYPSVLFAVGARGRYFLPLYPCLAVLIALIIDRCSTAELASNPRVAWKRYILGMGVMAGVAGVASIAIGGAPYSWADSIHQSRWFAIAFGVVSLATAWVCVRGFKSGTPRWNAASVIAIGILSSMTFIGGGININVERWNDPTVTIKEMKSRIPDPAKVVSLGPVDHRFVFYFESNIKELPWPTAEEPLPDDVEYFVFMRHPGDSARQRVAGRGRTWYPTPGTVPFEWEEIAIVDHNRVIRDSPQARIVLGRVTKRLRTASVDVTQPSIRK